MSSSDLLNFSVEVVPLLKEQLGKLIYALAITLSWKAYCWVRDIYKNLGGLPRRHVTTRLKLLRENMGDGSPLTESLEELEWIETFYAATKVRASWRTILALAHLCRHGFLSPNELKGMARFIRSDCSGVITVDFGKSAWCGMVLSMLLMFIGPFVGFVVLAFLIFVNSIPGFVVGSMLLVGFVLAAILPAGEAGIYRRAKLLKDDLGKYEIPLCHALTRHKKDKPRNGAVTRCACETVAPV